MPERLTSTRELDFAPAGDVYASPRDWRDLFIYQLLIDRFDNNAADLKPYDPQTAQRGRDPERGKQFQGGRIAGIARRLNYIRGLGCNAIWISPPFKNRQDDPYSYHGYGIQDFLSVDPRFGTEEDLRQLVREAHARGMYVIVDIVVNHSADVFRYKEPDTPFREQGRYAFGDWQRTGGGSRAIGPDDAIWPVELQDPECFTRRGHIRDLGNPTPDELVHADFFSFKDLNTDHPAVVDVLIKAYKYWIAAADIDGFRIDAARHVEPRFLARFCNAIREYTLRIGKDDFMIFGEIVGNDDLLHKYVGNNGPATGTDDWFPHLKAVLDFPLYGILDETIKGQRPCAALRERYEQFRQYFRDLGEAAQYYVTFVDNHDQSARPWRRFMHDVADWRIGVLGIGFLLCNLGIPCIYYGTEQGFDGGGDADAYVREAMFGGAWGAFDTTGTHFFNPKHPIYQGIAAIARVRSQQPALRYGRQYFRDISVNGRDFGCPSDGRCTLALSRVLDTEEVLVVLNLSDEARNDAILVDGLLSPAGSTMSNLLNPGGAACTVEKSENGSTAFVRVNLQSHELAVLKRR